MTEKGDKEKEGKYIYCISSMREPKTFDSLGIGGRGDKVYSICFDDIASVISTSPMIDYTLIRENVLAHEKAIEEVMEEHVVLPVRFSTIAEDEYQMKRILERDYKKFKNLINEMKNKKELGLKALFKKDVIYKHIAEKYKDIKKFKERIMTLPPEKTYFQRVELGEMVETALKQENEKFNRNVLKVLSPLAVEVKTNETYSEHMIMNASFLVEKDIEAEFDKRVQELDEIYHDTITFKYVGTLPPFNFVNLVIEIDRVSTPTTA